MVGDGSATCVNGTPRPVPEAHMNTPTTTTPAPMSHDEALARIAELERKLEASKSTGGIKVSAKGGVSVYGLGRWPVTLYQSQWATLLGKAEAIKAFIAAHASELAVKADD